MADRAWARNPLLRRQKGLLERQKLENDRKLPSQCSKYMLVIINRNDPSLRTGALALSLSPYTRKKLFLELEAAVSQLPHKIMAAGSKLKLFASSSKQHHVGVTPRSGCVPGCGKDVRTSEAQGIFRLEPPRLRVASSTRASDSMTAMSSSLCGL